MNISVCRFLANRSASAMKRSAACAQGGWSTFGFTSLQKPYSLAAPFCYCGAGRGKGSTPYERSPSDLKPPSRSRASRTRRAASQPERSPTATLPGHFCTEPPAWRKDAPGDTLLGPLQGTKQPMANDNDGSDRFSIHPYAQSTLAASPHAPQNIPRRCLPASVTLSTI